MGIKTWLSALSCSKSTDSTRNKNPKDDESVRFDIDTCNDSLTNTCAEISHHDPLEGPLGISVFCLRQSLLQEVLEAGLDETATVYALENLDEKEHGVIRSKGASNICPRDGKMGAAYVDCLEGIDNVGPANRILSYVWDYTIGDIIDSLEKYCMYHGLDPRRVYLWICCICNNHHRVGDSMPFNITHGMFYDNMVNVRHVLAMMAPWYKPTYNTRIWCLFELYTAQTINGCEVEIIMPSKEKESMLKSLKFYDDLVDVLSTVDIGNAEASKEADKVSILKLVKEDTDIATVNLNMKKLLKQCVRKMMMTALDEHGLELNDMSSNLEFASLCSDVGLIMHQQCNYDDSIALYNIALDIRKTAHGEDHEDTIATYNKIGMVMIHKGNLNGAIEMFKKRHNDNDNAYGEHDSTNMATKLESELTRLVSRIPPCCI